MCRLDTATSFGRNWESPPAVAAHPACASPFAGRRRHDSEGREKRRCDICRIFRGRMERLGPADLGRVLQFLGELVSVESEEPFPRELLASLRRLVPCDVLT